MHLPFIQEFLECDLFIIGFSSTCYQLLDDHIAQRQRVFWYWDSLLSYWADRAYEIYWDQQARLMVEQWEHEHYPESPDTD